MFSNAKVRVGGLLLFAGLSALAPSAFAGCSAIACNGIVEKIYTRTDGVTFLKIAGDRSLANCTLSAGAYFTLPADVPGGRNILAIAIAAQAAGRELNVRIIEGSTGCTVSYATLDS